MERRNRTVIGSYANRDEALDVVRRLRDEGYSREDITLYANRDVAERVGDTQGVDVTTETAGTADTADDRSLWEQIKDAFSTDTYDYDTTAQDDSYNADDDVLYPYRDDITNGNVVVVVDNYRGDSVDTVDTADTTGTPGVMGTTAGFPNADPAADPTVPTGSVTGMTDGDNLPPEADAVPPSDTINRDADVDVTNDTVDVDNADEKIRLKEERLDVDTRDVTTGEVNVRKEVVHDTETVEVPVEHEEVVIERKPVAGDEATTDTDFREDEESINIPVREEQIEVNKRPVVKEEVDIRKETHEDVKHVSEDVRREELDVDTEGDIRVEGTDEDLDRRNDRI